MHKKITLRSIDRSDALEQHILKKAEKLDKFFKREPLPVDIEIILESRRQRHHFQAEIVVKSKNYHLVAKSEGSEMYAMIDDAIHKIVREIAHKKEEMGHDITSHHLPVK